MIQLRLPPGLAGSALLLLATLGPRAAWALDECRTSADCGKGLACTVVSSGSCPGAPPCAPGVPCPEPAPCTIVEEKACTPAACTSDLQCGDGMVCHAWQTGCASTDCACASDEPSCQCDPAPECAATSESYCTPTYLLPCQAASDCGVGFDCVEETLTTCSSGGSAGRPAPQPGAPIPPSDGDTPESGSAGSSSSGEAPAPLPEPIEPSCTTEPAGVSHCVAKEIACNATSDCPVGWLCEQQSSEPQPGCAGEGCPQPAPLPPAKRLCRPEYGGGPGYDDSVSSPTAPGAAPLPGKGPTSGNQNGGNPEAASDDTHESTACQMGHAPASSGALSVLAVLGALMGLQRRRR